MQYQRGSTECTSLYKRNATFEASPLCDVMYLFDIDGTLTYPRKSIENNVREFLLNCDFTFSLVTGSDYEKVVEQVGSEICHKASFIFCCAANEIRRGNRIVEKTEIECLDYLVEFLENLLHECQYEKMFPKNIEIRTGMVNFSPLGREAPYEERLKYFEWDKKAGERQKFKEKIKSNFPDLNISIGGQISIDISVRDKSYTIDFLKAYGMRQFVFFGDKTDPGGNDHPLVAKLDFENIGVWYKVNSPEETLYILRHLTGKSLSNK